MSNEQTKNREHVKAALEDLAESIERLSNVLREGLNEKRGFVSTVLGKNAQLTQLDMKAKVLGQGVKELIETLKLDPQLLEKHGANDEFFAGKYFELSKKIEGFEEALEKSTAISRTFKKGEEKSETYLTIKKNLDPVKNNMADVLSQEATLQNQKPELKKILNDKAGEIGTPNAPDINKTPSPW